jgi:hypothetical protein
MGDDPESPVPIMPGHKAAIHAVALYNFNQAPTPRLAHRSTLPRPTVFPALSRELGYSLAQLGIVAPEFLSQRQLLQLPPVSR